MQKLLEKCLDMAVILPPEHENPFVIRTLETIHASHAKTGFLAVFKVAYKHPWNIHAWKPSYTELRYKKVKENGYDAVFAHAGKDLLNDEIIVYQDCQSTICYLLEMEQPK